MDCLSRSIIFAFYENSTYTNSEETRKLQQTLNMTEPFAYIVAAFNIALNALMIIGIVRTNKRLSLVNRLFLYSSVIGEMVGMLSPLYQVTAKLFSQDCLWHFVVASLLTFLLFIDVETLFTITILRYINFKKPFKRVSGQLLVMFMVIEALVALLVSILFFNT
eukprot:TCONS_00000938-protein